MSTPTPTPDQKPLVSLPDGTRVYADYEGDGRKVFVVRKNAMHKAYDFEATRSWGEQIREQARTDAAQQAANFRAKQLT